MKIHGQVWFFLVSYFALHAQIPHIQHALHLFSGPEILNIERIWKVLFPENGVPCMKGLHGAAGLHLAATEKHAWRIASDTTAPFECQTSILTRTRPMLQFDCCHLACCRLSCRLLVAVILGSVPGFEAHDMKIWALTDRWIYIYIPWGSIHRSTHKYASLL